MNAPQPATDASPDYSVVIPVYNSAASLRILVDQLARVFDQEVKASWEIIFVNDASPNEQTHLVLNDLERTWSQVRVVTFPTNRGQHPATLAGICRARGDYVIRMDDDLQHRPESIPHLIAQQQHQAVCALFYDMQTTGVKCFGSWLRSRLVPARKKAAGVRSSSFALYQRPLVDQLIRMDISETSIGTAVLRLSDDIVNVKIRHAPRHDGKSGYTIWKSIGLLFQGIRLSRKMNLRLAGNSCRPGKNKAA